MLVLSQKVLPRILGVGLRKNGPLLGGYGNDDGFEECLR